MLILMCIISIVDIAAFEKIDELTVFDNGKFVHLNREMLLEKKEEVEFAPKMVLGLNDGYVACTYSDNIYYFDISSYSVGGQIAFPENSYPYDGRLNPQGTEFWIADAIADKVYVIDRASNTITHSISVGEYSTGVTFSGDGSLVLVSARDGENITVIDATTYTVINTLSVTGQNYGPGFITYCPYNQKFYACEWYGPYLFEISSDGSTVERQTNIGGSLWRLISSYSSNLIYLLDRSSDSVKIVDVNTLTLQNTVSVGDDPWGIDITQDDSKLVVACEDSNNIYIIYTATLMVVIVNLSSSEDPRDVDIASDNNRAFITTGPYYDDVVVINLNSASIQTRIAPSGASDTNVVAVAPEYFTPNVPSLNLIGIIILLIILSLTILFKVRFRMN